MTFDGNRRRRVPFLRASFWRLVVGMPHLNLHGQVGDGREERLLAYFLENAAPGDPEDALRVIDEFSYNESHLINVGDRKGRILDDAVRRVEPTRVLELGAYCGYSALRMAVAAPRARILSLEFNVMNAAISRTVWEHAGVGDRVDAVVGRLDDERTVTALEQLHGMSEGNLDFVFIDHDKDAYVPDLQRILERRWLRKGALVVADNVGCPGAPQYHAYMKSNEGGRWRTEEHACHLEYQSILRDLVLVSELLEG